MWIPNHAAVLKSWSDEGLVGAALDIWVIDFKVSLICDNQLIKQNLLFIFSVMF